MRREFAKVITELAEKDDKIYLIVGDIGYKIFDEFREKFPDRFINIGLCEQSMIGIAAGMALSGLKPYVYTITPFLIERPFEQVKVDIGINNANVKLIGYADYPKLGPTHSCYNLHMLDRMMDCYYPTDAYSTECALNKIYKSNKPAFINLKKC